MKVVVSFAVAVLGMSMAHAELAPAAKIGRDMPALSVERNDATDHSARIAEDLERKVEALIEARVAEHLKSIAVEPELVARVD